MRHNIEWNRLNYRFWIGMVVAGICGYQVYLMTPGVVVQIGLMILAITAALLCWWGCQTLEPSTSRFQSQASSHSNDYDLMSMGKQGVARVLQNLSDFLHDLSGFTRSSRWSVCVLGYGTGLFALCASGFSLNIMGSVLSLWSMGLMVGVGMMCIALNGPSTTGQPDGIQSSSATHAASSGAFNPQVLKGIVQQLTDFIKSGHSSQHNSQGPK